MAHRAPHDHWRGLRLALPGPRIRVIVAMIGCLLSVGAPVIVFGVPGLSVNEQPARSPDDPARLGITGALPGDPLPDDGLQGAGGDGAPGDGTPDDPVGDGSLGFPLPPNPTGGPLGIPGVVLAAYQRAEQVSAATQPGCRLSWSLLAGIGRIESGHASGGRVDSAGTTLGPIRGRPLDGSPGVAAIPDTDRGALDADMVWDRAVGPMQFIPPSWRRYGVDGNADGVASPHNIYDSTIAAARYLCAGGGDLSDPAQLQAAVFRYNHSATYVAIVLRWAQAYRTGVIPTPSAQGPVPPGSTGNGGAPIVVGGVPKVLAVPGGVPQLAPLPPVMTTTTPLATPSKTITPTPPVTTTVETTVPPVTTTPETTAPPGTTPPETTTAPPGTTPPAQTTTPPAPATTTTPATESSPPPLPPPTTTPAEPASVPSPPPLA